MRIGGSTNAWRMHVDLASRPINTDVSTAHDGSPPITSAMWLAYARKVTDSLDCHRAECVRLGGSRGLPYESDVRWPGSLGTGLPPRWDADRREHSQRVRLRCRRTETCALSTGRSSFLGFGTALGDPTRDPTPMRERTGATCDDASIACEDQDCTARARFTAAKASTGHANLIGTKGRSP